MRGNQDPRSAPPALPVPWQSVGNVGVKHGLQSSELWAPGEHDSRQICDMTLAAGMWRVSVFGSQYLTLNVVFGTSKAKEIKGLRAPLRMCVAGQLAIYAAPAPSDTGAFVGAHAMVTCTPVTGARDSDARMLVTAPANLSPDAARFRALTSSSVRIDNLIDVPIAVGNVLPLIAGSVLTLGTGYLEFES